jgi:hypothetical protein
MVTLPLINLKPQFADIPRPLLYIQPYRIRTAMPPTPWAPDSYPPTGRSDHVDVYQSASRGEVQVPDPYQWMEENSNEVDEWTTAQTAFTQAYLDQNADRLKFEGKFRASKDYAKVIDGSMDHSIYRAVLRTLPTVFHADPA